ncbi:MAG: helix-turn-helix transcriptional regulator, partial [Phaeodactylibacter sp.]|nr:helix-turn-helix transcriptional regulator [Phaeodactylibacter sp.]
ELEVRLRKLVELRRQLREKYRHAGLIEENGQSHADDPELTFLRKLQKAILDNLGNEHFKVEPHLCQAMAMSRPQLYRKLKALKDTSPSELIRQVRLQQARRLLLQTQLNIGDIAEKVGFKGHSYFTRSYTAEFGESPSETRDSLIG